MAIRSTAARTRAAGRTSVPEPAGRPPTALLALQRQAGNRAVAALLAATGAAPLPVQRTIVLGDGTVTGFANRKDYKQLPATAKSAYAAMQGDKQYAYAFDTKADLYKFLAGVPAVPEVEFTPFLVQQYARSAAVKADIRLIERRRDFASVEAENAATLAARKPGEKKKPDLAPIPFGPSGHSTYVAATEPHVHNWRELVRIQLEHARALWRKNPLSTTLPQPAQLTQLMDDLAGRATRLAEVLDQEDVHPSHELGAAAAATPLRETEELHELLSQLGAAATHGNTAFFLAHRPPRPSVPRFGSLRQSMGTWAEIVIEKYGAMPEGSSASGSRTFLPWQENFLRHRAWGYPEAENLYVRGHLLNDHLGGPARSYNLVPLTGVSTTQPNANKAHEAGVEGSAKTLVREMFARREAPRDPLDSAMQDPHSIEAVTYRVEVAAWGQSRSGTAEVRSAQDDADYLLSVMKPTGGAGRVSVTQFAEWVRAQPYGHMWGPVYAAMKAVAKRGVPLADEPVVDVVLRMKLNADLWEYEDEHIPQRLDCQVTVTPLNAEPKQFAVYAVPNALPDDVVRMRYV